MIILDNVISDRGSRYSVSGGPCRSAEEARAFLADLKRSKKFAKATHNSWGLICGEQMIKNDDGEAGAGMVILRMLEREGMRDHIVVVNAIGTDTPRQTPPERLSDTLVWLTSDAAASMNGQRVSLTGRT